MKGRKKTLFRSLIWFLCCAALCVSAFAATGSLRVSILDGDAPVQDIAVELCLVADLEDGAYTLTQAFANLHLTAEEMVRDLGAEQAEQVYQYVIHNELEGPIILTDEEGNADFHSITDGLYLVFERGDQAVAFRPYLITIPTEGRYGVYSVPKTDSGDVKNISVIKEWNDNDNAAGKRPESIGVTLSHNGTPIRSVTLNEECGWEHTFLMLPADGTYTAEESAIPDYTCTYEEVFEGFLLTNTYTPKDDPEKPNPKPDRPVRPNDTPDDPKDPTELERPETDPPTESEPTESEPTEPGQTAPAATLPQTGFRMWPVYATLGLGVALTVIGLTDIFLGKEEAWEDEQEES